jgi:hypothetical protein
VAQNRRSVNVENERLKKRRSKKAFERDCKHGCFLGSAVYIDSKKYLIAVTSAFFVYLVTKTGKIKRIKWSKWDELDKIRIEPFWSKEVIEAIKYIKKRTKFTNKSIGKAKVKRQPKIKRTPVKKR